MSEVLASPAFGQADLTNCERELIHLAGSIQPHGILLVLDPISLVVIQCSENARAVLRAKENLLNQGLGSIGGDLEHEISEMLKIHDLAEPQPFRCRIPNDGSPALYEGMLHKNADGGIVVEIEPAYTFDSSDSLTQPSVEDFESFLSRSIEKFSAAASILALSDTVVQVLRAMTGYDRVMVYKFDPDGHGKIIAEARETSLDSLLGHHYPATDIPQRARELYLRTRVRVLADVNYVPVPINPEGNKLDMSLCYLRSMSPLHLQYLKNMGVTATLVVSLVREGKLWGLIACHHYRPRKVEYGVRATCGLLAEAISTRIAAIENYAHAQGVILVRSLEQRLIEATSTDGDWRRALIRNPRTLLQPVDATGAVLFFEGEILTVGEVPSTPELRELVKWISERTSDSMFCCSSVARENPKLASITPTASGVLAIELSSSRPDFLVWLRREQLSEVTWAGDPSKAVIDNDPMNLSPRRSFAAWSQIVRDSASPWSNAEIALARAIGFTLIDIILQIQSVRLLIAQHQLSLVSVTVDNSKEPVVIADADGRIIFINEAFSRQLPIVGPPIASLDDLVGSFAEAEQAKGMLRTLRNQQLSWRGELTLSSGQEAVPVSVRADIVLGPQATVLGYLLIFTNLTGTKRADAARRNLERALWRASRGTVTGDDGSSVSVEPDGVVNSILSNARLAALDIADGGSGGMLAPLIEELETATQRAMAIYLQMQAYRQRQR